MDFSELKKAVQKASGHPGARFHQGQRGCAEHGLHGMNATQKLIFSISTFKGKKYFSVRTWFQAESGEWAPTKKGINLSFEKFDEFENMVKLFAQAIQLDK